MMDDGRDLDHGSGSGGCTHHGTRIKERIEKDDVHLWPLREEHCSAADDGDRPTDLPTHTTIATTTPAKYLLHAPGVRGAQRAANPRTGAKAGAWVDGLTGMSAFSESMQGVSAALQDAVSDNRRTRIRDGACK